ncbi:MAG: hypothetical protein AUH30_12655 [Candidatus Rokubacteria bacterium 13_1_40CM_68_15]|nr:MAG: hypothetical protein AUH30_12655 [Candidatus Rokubacteria bacterium 13_1_40CM_68_15]
MKRTSVGRLAGVPVVAFAVVVALLAWRSRGWPLIHDAPIMHYIAWRIAGGAVPYRDVFDMNFPGVYVLHGAVLRALGPGDHAWRAFDLAWLGLGGACVAALAAPWGAVAAVGGALVFAAYHLAGGAGQAGQRDFLLCPFLLVGALGVARWLERRRVVDLAWGGLALGAGVTLKPHAIVFAGLLAVVVAVRVWRSSAGALAAGVFPSAVAVAPAAVMLWLATIGALPAWRAIVVDYLLPLYGKLGRPPAWGFHRWQVWIPLGAAVVLSVAGAVTGRRFSMRHLVVSLGVLYGLVHYVSQGKGWEYHVYPLAAFASVLAFAELAAAWRTRRWPTAVAVAVALLIAAVMLQTKGAEAAAAVRAGWISDKAQRVNAVVADLRPRLGPGDTVQVLDTTEGGIHALLRLGVAEPSRFVYDFHFFHDVTTPVVRGLRAELVDALRARPPRLIVVFARGWPARGAERVDTFPELRQLLERAYRPDATGDGYVIHAKRDGS